MLSHHFFYLDDLAISQREWIPYVKAAFGLEIKQSETLSLHLTPEYVNILNIDNDVEPEYRKILRDRLGIASEYLFVIENGAPIISQGFEFDSVYELIGLDVIETANRNVKINKCKNCGRYFVPDSRSDEIYCSRVVGESNKTCKEIGPVNSYKNSISNTPYLEERQKFYQSLHAATIRPMRNDPEGKAKASKALKDLMGEVDSKVGEIERADDGKKETLIVELLSWFDQKRSELMPRRRAK